MTFVLASFFIGLGTAYLFSKLWHGQGTLLAHTYCLLLCTVPLVTISGLLLVLPATGSLVAVLVGLVFLLFVYRMILHGFTIMAVHGLSGGRASLIVLIIPMIIAAIALLVGLVFLGGEGLFSAFEFSGSEGKRKESEPRINRR